ncbi:MAG: hypothetical protein WA990_16530 [Rubrobacteraceae bacterium]
MASRRNGSSGQQQGIPPRFRRGFGCVTWIYMATLAFLAVASFGLMPIWFVAGWDVFSLLEGLAFYAMLLFLPAIALAAFVGVRTYRVPRQQGKRAGAAVGTVVGLTGFVFLSWLENVADRGFAGAGFIYWLTVPAVLAAGVLVLYAVFPGKMSLEQRRRVGLIGAAIVGVTGLVLLAANFSLLQVVVALVSTLAGAGGGWTAGIGYARAGGDELIPPNAQKIR